MESGYGRAGFPFPSLGQHGPIGRVHKNPVPVQGPHHKVPLAIFLGIGALADKPRRQGKADPIPGIPVVFPLFRERCLLYGRQDCLLRRSLGAWQGLLLRRDPFPLSRGQGVRLCLSSSRPLGYLGLGVFCQKSGRRFRFCGAYFNSAKPRSCQQSYYQ